MLKIDKYYDRPWSIDEYSGNYVKDARGKKMCDFLIRDEIIKGGVLDLLNGRELTPLATRVSTLANEEGCTIRDGVLSIGSVRVLCIKGWGHLTVSLGLDDKTAAEEQKGMLEEYKKLILLKEE